MIDLFSVVSDRIAKATTIEALDSISSRITYAHLMAHGFSDEEYDKLNKAISDRKAAISPKE